jgi:prenyltransferase beta subunit
LFYQQEGKMVSTLNRLRRNGVAWLAALMVFVTAAGVASATPEFPDVANAALTWMKGQQQPDGSFPGFGAGSSVDALLAFVSAQDDKEAGHEDLHTYTQQGSKLITFLESKAADLAKSPGGAGKLLLAVAANKLNGKAFGGVDLVGVINASYDAKTGHYGSDVIGHAFAILGLAAAGEIAPPDAGRFLINTQTPEGGWSFSGETAPSKADTNTTAVVVQALLATRGLAIDPDVYVHAFDYLMSQRNEDGGFPYQKGGEFGSESDVNSTSYVAQALIALNYDERAGLAKGFIRSMQLKSGAFQWMKSDPSENADATYQAIPALLDATLIDPAGVSREGGVAPGGMPTTGQSSDIALALAMAVLAALALSAGLYLRGSAIPAGKK